MNATTAPKRGRRQGTHHRRQPVGGPLRAARADIVAAHLHRAHSRSLLLDRYAYLWWEDRGIDRQALDQAIDDLLAAGRAQLEHDAGHLRLRPADTR